MSISCMPGSAWPSRIANIAAAIFISASGTTNVVYGFSKGDSLATSLVWAGVAGAVAIVFALAWPALIKSVDTKRWSAALISLVALLLAGAYSVTAALGSASGGRANATATETATTDARTKAQSAYDTAKAELDTLAASKPASDLQALIAGAQAELAKLPPARPAAEIDALIRGAAMNPRGAHGCTAINGSLRMSCPKLEAEKARADQRERLTGKITGWTVEIGQAEQRLQVQRAAARAAMDRASGELAKIQPAKVANSDAVALARYLGALGLHVTPTRLNDLLVLLAVLMIESGGGLSLAIGMALSGPPARAPEARPDSPATEARTDRTPPANAQDAPADTASGQAEHSRTPPVVQRPALAVQPSELTAWLRLQGGRAETSMRRLASVLGRSPSGVHEELRRLVASGLITAVPSCDPLISFMSTMHSYTEGPTTSSPNVAVSPFVS